MRQIKIFKVEHETAYEELEKEINTWIADNIGMIDKVYHIKVKPVQGNHSIYLSATAEYEKFESLNKETTEPLHSLINMFPTFFEGLSTTA